MASRTIESDDELWVAFAGATLPHDCWTHTAHVRVGYLHVVREGFDTALELLRVRIKRLNAAHGTPETPTRGYHETILPGWGTFYAFANVEQAMRDVAAADDNAFAEFLINEAGVAVVPGSAFGAPGHVRLSFAASAETLADALGRMGRALAAAPAKRRA